MPMTLGTATTKPTTRSGRTGVLTSRVATTAATRPVTVPTSNALVSSHARGRGGITLMRVRAVKRSIAERLRRADQGLHTHLPPR